MGVIVSPEYFNNTQTQSMQIANLFKLDMFIDVHLLGIESKHHGSYFIMALTLSWSQCVQRAKGES